MKKIITILLSLVVIASLALNVFAAGFGEIQENIKGKPLYTSPENLKTMNGLKGLKSFKITEATKVEKEYNSECLGLKVKFSKKQGTCNFNLLEWTSEKPIKYVFIKGSKCGHLYDVANAPNGTNYKLVLPKALQGAKFLYVEFFYNVNCFPSPSPSPEVSPSPEASSTPEVSPEVSPSAEVEINVAPDEELPKTGESSSIMFTIVGLLVIASSLLLIRKKMIRQ
jgi:LPXTG-motif cell wall-anchored protein